MHRLLFLLMLSALAPFASAASEFWVCVATTEDVAGAQRVVGEASGALREPLLVRAVQTSDGVRQRVVAGPYPTRADALAVQQRAQQSGYPNSYIYAGDEGGTLAAAPSGDGASHTAPSAMSKGEAELPPVEDYQSGMQSPEVRAAIESGKLPTAIPPGYQLNKLYRDGVVPTPQQPQ
jgi:SPOR domain